MRAQHRILLNHTILIAVGEKNLVQADSKKSQIMELAVQIPVLEHHLPGVACPSLPVGSDFRHWPVVFVAESGPVPHG